MTLQEFNSNYAPLINCVAAVLGLLSLFLLWLQIKKSNDWNRVAATFAIMELERFYVLEEEATKQCKALDIPFPASISTEAGRKIRENYDAYHAVKNLVIFLDRICVAYQAGYIDKDVLTLTYGPIIFGYHDLLKNYIDLARKELNAPETYRDFGRTADDVRDRIDKCRAALKSHENTMNSLGGISRKL